MTDLEDLEDSNHGLWHLVGMLIAHLYPDGAPYHTGLPDDPCGLCGKKLTEAPGSIVQK